MVSASGSKLLDAIIVEQFRRFRKRIVFTSSDEDLDTAAKAIGCRSLADMRTVALFSVFLATMERAGRWN